MNSGELFVTLFSLWAIWFVIGGGLAIFRLVIGILGFKEETKWSGFKLFFYGILVNAGLTVWFFIEHGGSI